jgi:hypothetical protein
MNMELVVTKRIAALESIMENLRGAAGNRGEHYQEKCDIYRKVLADLARERLLSEDQTHH